MPLRRPEFYLTSVVGQGGMGRGGVVTPGGAGGGGAVSPYVLGPTASYMGASTGTTGAITTTGCTLIAIYLQRYSFPAGGTPATITDLKSNVWTAMTEYQTDDISGRWYYCVNPTVGTGHTFTVTCVTLIGGIAVLTFTGGSSGSPFVSETGATANAGTSVSPGALTPPAAQSLILTGISDPVPSDTPTLATPFTAAVVVPTGAGYGFGTGYYAAATASATNSTWTMGSSNYWASAAVCFRAAP